LHSESRRHAGPGDPMIVSHQDAYTVCVAQVNGTVTSIDVPVSG
jgi:hypothetical protein